jgi:hypothetical protein
MRKFWIAAVAAVSVLAVAAVAYAANEYTVDGSTSPRGKGTATKPLPVSLKFDFTVGDTNEALRGTPVEKYFIGAEGLVTYPEEFPTCPYSTASGGGANAQEKSVAQKACKKARVGGGIIKAYAGASPPPESNSEIAKSAACVLDLNLYNLKPGNYGIRGKVTKKHGALGIRIDAKQASIPNLNDEHKGKCATAQNEAILAPYKPVKIKGVRSDELQFTVPQSLLHPSGLETVVQQVESAVKKMTATKRIAGKNRKVGFYSAVGCKGNQRSLQVTFISEDKPGSPAVRTPLTENMPC